VSSITADEAWRDAADEVAAFHRTHSRWPRTAASDPVEKGLEAWLSTQGAQAGGGTNAHLLTPDRRAYLDKVAPGWLPETDSVQVAA
jgi:hypothetical protein